MRQFLLAGLLACLITPLAEARESADLIVYGDYVLPMTEGEPVMPLSSWMTARLSL